MAIMGPSFWLEEARRANIRAHARANTLMRIRAERARSICSNAYMTELAFLAREQNAGIDEISMATGWTRTETIRALKIQN